MGKPEGALAPSGIIIPSSPIGVFKRGISLQICSQGVLEGRSPSNVTLPLPLKMRRVKERRSLSYIFTSPFPLPRGRGIKGDGVP